MTQYQEKIVGKPGGLVEPGVKQYGFLKKIFKPVKKVAKKVWKSPLGKAALIGGGLYGLGGLQSLGGTGMFQSGQGLQRFRNIASMFGKKGALGDLFFSGKGADRKFSIGKAGLMGLLGAGATLPFMGGDEEEEEVGPGWDVTPSSIASIRDMARNRDPSLAFLPRNEYVQSGFYAADGGLASLANGGGVAEAKAEQMLKMEYQKYRNQGGTMSYQRFKMMVLQQAQGQGPMAQGQPQMAQPQMAQPQMAADGGRIGYQRGGPPGGGDPGMRGTGRDYGSSYGPGRTRGGGGPDVMSATTFTSPNIQPNQGNKNSNRVSTILENVDAGNKLKNFATSGNPVDLLKINPMLLGANMLWNKFRGNKQDDEASLPSAYDFSGIQDHRAEVTRNQYNQLKSLGQVGNTGGNIDEVKGLVPKGTFDSIQPSEWKEIFQGNKFKDITQVVAEGGRVGRAEGGIMDLGGMEKDYRAEGGFVPIGGKEKADDVPARLSKNEFVFTADAVRNAGGGDIDAGAEVMQNMMENLESGGQISEESQGAQGMYNQQQMLQSRMA